MLEKDEVKALYGFADTASDRELRHRADDARAAMDVLPHGTEDWRDARLVLRIMLEAIACRADVTRIHAEYELRKLRRK